MVRAPNGGRPKQRTFAAQASPSTRASVRFDIYFAQAAVHRTDTRAPSRQGAALEQTVKSTAFKIRHLTLRRYRYDRASNFEIEPYRKPPKLEHRDAKATFSGSFPPCQVGTLTSALATRKLSVSQDCRRLARLRALPIRVPSCLARGWSRRGPSLAAKARRPFTH